MSKLNIDWDKIKNECPKAYKLFLKYKGLLDINVLLKKRSLKHMTEVKLINCNSCFCDIVDFFDEHDIIIELHYLGGWYFWHCNKAADWKGYYAKSEKGQKRNEARLQAIYKAFEILEKAKNKEVK
jgi:hypothetical protein